MRVSVIVTTYNNPEYLMRVLEGLLDQRRPPDELIVADDGSGEDTAMVVRNLSAMADFPVIHVWQEDKGFRLAKIRNEAIKRATGEYLIILDGDSIPPRNFIYDHISLAERGFFVQGKRVLVNERASRFFTKEDANSFSRLLRLLISGSISNGHHILPLRFFPSFKNTRLKGIKGCNMSFFRDDLLAVNGYNEDFIGWGREDSELAIRLYRYGLKRKEHPFRAICYHLWHPPHPRDSLIVNDRILQKTISEGGYFCANGIVKR